MSSPPPYLHQARRQGELVVNTTPEICPPEVAAALLDGRPHQATPSMDLWSLGCVIYHLVVGKPLLQVSIMSGGADYCPLGLGLASRCSQPRFIFHVCIERSRHHIVIHRWDVWLL